MMREVQVLLSGESAPSPSWRQTLGTGTGERRGSASGAAGGPGSAGSGAAAHR